MTLHRYKKPLILTIKILIVLAVAGWVAWELYKSWGKIHLLDWRPDYAWLTFSAFLYVIAYIPAAWFWYYAMRSLGQHPGLYETFRAYYIGHLGKYVPGKAMVVVLRSGLVQSDRTRASVAAAAVFLETLTMMATGAFLAALIIIIWFRDMPNGGWLHDIPYIGLFCDMPYGGGLMLLALGMMVVSGLPVLPPVFRATALRLGVGRNDPDIAAKLRGLNFRTLAVGWCLTGISWIFLGLSLWATIRGMGIETGPLSDVLPRFTLAASLSVVLGFVLMIPGGFLVREFGMAQVLILYFADQLVANGMSQPEAIQLATLQALVVASVQRMISIFGELIASAIMIRKWK